MTITIEDELNLIKKKGPLGAVVPTSAVSVPEAPAPAPQSPALAAALGDLSDTFEQAVTPSADPAQPAPASAPPIALEDAPPLETGLAPPPSNDASTWDVLGAAWTRDTIAGDVNGYASGKRRDLTMEMFNSLPPEAKTRTLATQKSHRSDWVSFEQKVMDEAAKFVATDPAKWGDLPLTQEQFDMRLKAEDQAILADAEAILNQPGGAIAEFIGSAARDVTRPINLALMPLGLGGSATRFIVSEMILSGVSATAALPGKYAAAERLDLPDPNAVAEVATETAIGGLFAGGLVGIAKGFNWATGRTRTAIEARPEGESALEFGAKVDRAEAELTGDRTVQEATKGAGGAVGVQEAGAGYTVIVGPDGKAVRREGSRAWRNNNPGNIEFGPFARSMGAVGTDGRFAVFPSYEAGRKAKGALLFASKGYRGKTIAQAIARYAPSFENDTGAYTRAVSAAIGVRSDTPTASLTPAQRELMLDAMERVEGFKPGTENGVQARAPRKGISTPLPDEDMPSFAEGGTSRGYTGSGQVAAGDGTRVDVDYEVVDYASLIRASGDLQPRDRSRINSDAWIADTAAQLDPAQLMPSPNAAQGAPIIGPDNIIESGNGRVSAIGRAYERVPDRAQAYRAAIEGAGYSIPEGVTQPVLVARRRSALTPAERQRFVIEAQDSGVAQMTPTEVARATARNLGAPILARLDPTQPVASAANGDFVRAALATLPRSARNAMFEANGTLNANGQRQLREALFARAWPDPDILARYTEGGSPELKSLLEALEAAAPNWAALRADIEAGLVSPEMDISAFVLDAMRLIGAARDLSAKQGLSIGKAVAELLDEVDMLEGAISPLTAALVRKFWSNGRAAPADQVGLFLARYADEARNAGKSGGMFDAPSPRDVLRTVDAKTFADLPEDLGRARGFATKTEPQASMGDDTFTQGAQSPEVEAVHAEIEASIRQEVEDGGTVDGKTFGPIYEVAPGDWRGAIDVLKKNQTGEVSGALTHPLAEKISLVWGEVGTGPRSGSGLAKIAARHPEVLDDLQGRLTAAQTVISDSPNRLRLSSDRDIFIISKDRFGKPDAPWLLTAYEVRGADGRSMERAAELPKGSSPSAPARDQTTMIDTTDQGPGLSQSADPTLDQAAADAFDAQRAIAAARAGSGAFEMKMPDGTTYSAAEVLDDIDADADADFQITFCTTNTGA